MVVNLRLVRFIDSTGMASILEAARALQGAGGGIAISQPSDFCKEILLKLGLDQIVPIAASDEEAGRALIADIVTP